MIRGNYPKFTTCNHVYFQSFSRHQRFKKKKKNNFFFSGVNELLVNSKLTKSANENICLEYR
jgi:hypothetical protein